MAFLLKFIHIDEANLKMVTIECVTITVGVHGTSKLPRYIMIYVEKATTSYLYYFTRLQTDILFRLLIIGQTDKQTEFITPYIFVEKC